MRRRLMTCSFLLFGLAILFDQAKCLALDSIRIRVENVDLQEPKHKLLDDAAAWAFGAKTVKVDLENLRCSEREDCSGKPSYLSVGNQLKKKGYQVEQVEIDETAPSSATRNLEPDVIVRIEKVVTRTNSYRTLSQWDISGVVTVNFHVLRVKTGDKIEFSYSSTFTVDFTKDKAKTEQQAASLAADLFSQEKDTVRQVAEWIEKQ